MQDLRLSELIGALSFALDITEGQPAGHAARSCVIGVRFANHLELSEAERFSLFYALLLKDCGCSSIGSQVAELYGHDDQAVKSTLRAIDHRKPIAVLGHAIRNTEPGGGFAGLGSRAKRFAGLLRNGASSARELNTIRCDRGADIARMVGLDERGVDGIRSINEHWDGGGIPDGIAGEEIPLLARIMGIAQAVEVELTRGGARHALEVLQSRAGTWFDPSLVADLVVAASDPGFWEGLDGEGDVHAVLAPLEPGDRLIVADDTRLDRVAEAFARVIDAKSPYTARHSDGVARFAVLIAERLGFTRATSATCAGPASCTTSASSASPAASSTSPASSTTTSGGRCAATPSSPPASWARSSSCAISPPWPRRTTSASTAAATTSASARRSSARPPACSPSPTSRRR